MLGGEAQHLWTHSLFKRNNALLTGIKVYADKESDVGVRGSSPGARAGVTTGNADLNTLVFAFYMQDKLNLTERLSVWPGFRVERIDQTMADFFGNRRDKANTDQFIPGLGLSYRISRAARVYFNAERAFQPPQFRQALSPGRGQENLDAQRATKYDAGVRTWLGERLSLNLALFRIGYGNQIITVSGVLQNAGQTRHQGLEGGIDARLLKGLSGFFNFTLLDTAFENGRFKGNRLPYAPRQMYNWGFSYYMPAGLTATLDSRWVSRQFSDDANTRLPSSDGNIGPIPAYDVWNLRLNYKVKKHSLFLGLTNLFNEKYFTERFSFFRGLFPAPGRRFQLGWSVDLF